MSTHGSKSKSRVCMLCPASACDSQIDFETRNPMTRLDQSTSDSFNWTLASGATASGNNTPKVDQTTGTGAGEIGSAC